VTLVDDVAFMIHSLHICCCHYLFYDARVSYGVVMDDSYILFELHVKICYDGVGLGGPDPSSELVVPTNKTLHYWPFWKQPT